MRKLFTFSVLIGAVTVANAATPLVDLSAHRSGAPVATQQLVQMERRLNYVEGTDEKVQLLEKEIQSLHGQLEILMHQVKQLQDQQRLLYADLDQRLKQSAAVPGQTAANTPVTPMMVISSPEKPKQAASKGEKEAYEAAYKLVQRKQYTGAIESMRTFLHQHPSGQYAVNAHYWLGELYALTGEEAEAINEFNTVTERYSKAAKAADALLKLAFIYDDRGDPQTAKRFLTKLAGEFAGSTSAELGAKRIRHMQEGGRW